MRVTPLTLSLCLIAAPAVAEDQFLMFTSPSGNIQCSMVGGDEPGVRCDMLTLTQTYTMCGRPFGFKWLLQDLL